MSMERAHATPLFPVAVLILGVILSIVGVLTLEAGPEMLFIGGAVCALGVITLISGNDRVPRK